MPEGTRRCQGVHARFLLASLIPPCTQLSLWSAWLFLLWTKKGLVQVTKQGHTFNEGIWRCLSPFGALGNHPGKYHCRQKSFQMTSLSALAFGSRPLWARLWWPFCRVKFIRLEEHNTSQCPVKSSSRQQVYNGVKNSKSRLQYSADTALLSPFYCSASR